MAIRFTDGDFKPNEHEVKEIIHAPLIVATGMFLCPNKACQTLHVAMLGPKGEVVGHMVVDPMWLTNFFLDGMAMMGYPTVVMGGSDGVGAPPTDSKH